MTRFCVVAVLILIHTQLPVAFAGDFDWMDRLNIKAEADSSGYRIRLATRFRIGDAEVKAVLSNVNRLSDAYMVFRLGELSHRSPHEVLKVYRANRNKGWGVMAKQLGIKPGSRAFHALKRGHDLDDRGGNEPMKASKSNKGKGKGKHKHK